ncbi:hypothetical protein [Jiangella mangrovi]|uniref:ABC-type bacteriocin/lantibiotic exporter with double-glycine peptidase domain n=1 Tax=Jiangella mangrovi TaxID=1524084 RepID=A0A7W9LK92_9ACTN|nr:hypothetical protein [Jiangella mangrovi]MBB5786883.1 ABC-type bacteriocin/lantibiotic exporter with double-glycine peptidase domain [Jiangella mangrovi]
MNERRFELIVSWILLGFTVWYLATMASYSNNAGRVPAITAAVAGVALIVQIVTLYVRRDKAAHEEAHLPHLAEAVLDRADARTEGHEGEHQHLAEELEDELEKDSYDTLIAIKGVRRTRFLAMAAFCVLFYVGILIAGFVVTTGVLIAAIMLTAKEKPYTAVIAGLAGAAAAYGLVVSLMGLQPWTGYLFVGLGIS